MQDLAIGGVLIRFDCPFEGRVTSPLPQEGFCSRTNVTRLYHVDTPNTLPDTDMEQEIFWAGPLEGIIAP